LFAVAKLILTDAQRTLLKRPLGESVTGSPAECNRRLKQIQENEKPHLLILVGDTISRNAVQYGIKPNVMIIDQKEKRAQATDFVFEKPRMFRTRNDAGTIDLLAWSAVAEAIEQGDSVVLVDGEEDLLTLVAVSVAPEGSIVAYGQPEQGIIVVRTTAEKKAEIARIVDGMKRE
jgi:uncharacterized protein (UPF0218 family)